MECEHKFITNDDYMIFLCDACGRVENCFNSKCSKCDYVTPVMCSGPYGGCRIKMRRVPMSDAYRFNGRFEDWKFQLEKEKEFDKKKEVPVLPIFEKKENIRPSCDIFTKVGKQEVSETESSEDQESFPENEFTSSTSTESSDSSLEDEKAMYCHSMAQKSAMGDILVGKEMDIAIKAVKEDYRNKIKELCSTVKRHFKKSNLDWKTLKDIRAFEDDFRYIVDCYKLNSIVCKDGTILERLDDRIKVTLP